MANENDYSGFSPFLMNADNYNLKNGDGSAITGFNFNLLTKMAPAALVSGLTSIANSAIAVGNLFPGEETKQLDTKEILGNIDSSVAQYYSENQQAADVVGFVATSFGVGGLGVKGLRMLQAGKGTPTLTTGLNFLRNKSDDFLAKAITEATTEGSNVFRLISANKMKALAFGVADEALTTAAFETAVAATMFQSPIFEGMDIKDRIYNAGVGIALGGVIGGGFSYLGQLGKFNKAVTEAEMAARPQESLDVLLQSKTVTEGDAAFKLLDSLKRIPSPKTAEEATRVAKTAEKAKVEATMLANKLANGDAELGNAFISSLYRTMDDLATVKTPSNELWDPLETALVRLNKVSRITADDAFESDRIFIRREVGVMEDGKFTAKVAEVNKRSGDVSEYYGTPFKYIGDSSRLKMATSAEFNTAKEAYDAGYDLYFKGTGRVGEAGDHRFALMVNPQSQIIKKLAPTETPGYEASLILNTKTGDFTSTAVPTLPDLVPISSMRLTKDKAGLSFGGAMDEMKFGLNSIEDLTKLSTQEANGRFIWAHMLPDNEITKMSVINAADLPLLERLAEIAKAGKLADDSTLVIKLADGTTKPVQEFLGKFDDLITDVKTAEAQKLFDLGKQFDEVSISLNAPKQFLEEGTGASYFTRDELLKPTHVKLNYDVKGSLQTPDGMIMRGVADVEARIKLAKELNHSVTAAYYGNAVKDLPEIKDVMAEASSLRAGPGAFSASNGNYGSIASKTQQIGKMTMMMSQRGISESTEAITHSASRLLENADDGVHLGMIMNKMRASGERYKLVAYDELPPEIGRILFQNQQGFKLVHKEYLNALLKQDGSFVGKQGVDLTFETSEAVGRFLRDNMARNDSRIGHFNRIADAKGQGRVLEAGDLYIPPINTDRYKHFAYVVEERGTIFGENSVGVIVARDEAELARLTARVPEGYKWYSKGEIAKFHKAKGDFDSDLLFSENRVNSMLRKQGILSELHPTTDGKALVNEWLDWHAQQEIKLARNMTELHYAQEIKEFRFLGERYTNLATSRMSFGSTDYQQFIKNPYEDHVKQMLNINKMQEYKMWSDANRLVEGLGSKAFNAWNDAAARVRKGEISWEEANRIARNYGYDAPFKSALDFQLANSTAETGAVSKFVNSANAFLASTVLRLDFFNPLVNILSTPIMLGAEMQSLRKAIIAKDAKLAGELAVKVPGTDMTMGAQIKLVYNAIRNYFSDQGPALVAKYKEAGVIRDIMQQHLDTLNSISVKGTESSSWLVAKAKELGDLGAKYTGNNFAEEFTRFISANVMDQMTTMAGLSQKEASSYINTFVNRVQGNYVASQRPIAFQGPIGHAIGLFQTYQFNLMQQLLRFAENRDKAAMVTLAGLQTSLYGLQGLPAFQALNTHIVGNAPGNATHQDFYSTVPKIVGKDVGDWLMYGLPSNMPWLSSAMFTRGDINPRQMTILPSELSQVPVVAATVKVMDNLKRLGETMGDGGKFYNSMLLALEHNGMNRPLAGLAQWAHGRTTTSEGKLISEIDRTALSNVVRFAGSKPLDEAIALEGMYRNKAYKAKDLERMKDLGRALRTHYYGGTTPTSEELEDFATKYAASGGRLQEFQQFVMSNMRGANVSVVNQSLKNLSSPLAQNMMVIMGGEELPDAWNAPPSQ